MPILPMSPMSPTAVRLPRIASLLFLLLLLVERAITLNVVVIGGGAAGYFGAVEAARLLHEFDTRVSQTVPNIDTRVSQSPGYDGKCQVTILEATNAVLSKVLISGGGRCNVMHNPVKGAKEIAKGYPRGTMELLGPLSSQFGPWETFDWFSQRSVELKTEKDGRVFPCTDRSTTIIEALQKEAKKNNVKVICGAKVTGISRTMMATEMNSACDESVPLEESSGTPLDEPRFVVRYSSKNGEETERLPCDCILLATGSSRVGHKLAASLGHSIAPPVPSLFSFKIQVSTSEQYITANTEALHRLNAYNPILYSVYDDSDKKDPETIKLAGTTVERAQIKLLLSVKDLSKMKLSAESASELKALLRPHRIPSYTQEGPLLFTHQGISGPVVLRLSAFAAKVVHCLGYRFNVSINFLPDASEENVIEMLSQEKRKHPMRLVAKGFPLTELNTANNDHTGSNTGDDDEIEDASTAQRGKLISKRLWQYILSRCDLLAQRNEPESLPQLNSETGLKWESMSKRDIQRLAKELTCSVHSISGRGEYRDEFVTCGGVELKEVSFETMESKVCPGLFLAGEVLDIDGVTGGYNFQSAWSTGWIAGHHAAQKIIDCHSCSQSDDLLKP